jgi:hypothetical protein
MAFTLDYLLTPVRRLSSALLQAGTPDWLVDLQLSKQLLRGSRITELQTVQAAPTEYS